MRQISKKLKVFTHSFCNTHYNSVNLHFVDFSWVEFNFYRKLMLKFIILKLNHFIFEGLKRYPITDLAHIYWKNFRSFHLWIRDIGCIISCSEDPRIDFFPKWVLCFFRSPSLTYLARRISIPLILLASTIIELSTIIRPEIIV